MTVFTLPVLSYHMPESTIKRGSPARTSALRKKKKSYLAISIGLVSTRDQLSDAEYMSENMYIV